MRLALAPNRAVALDAFSGKKTISDQAAVHSLNSDARGRLRDGS